jgi:anti-sigma factor RsiW
LTRQLSCKQFIDFLDDYLAGNQAEEVRAEFERHLAICPYCVDYLRTYQATVQLVGHLRRDGDGQPQPPADAPKELIDAVLAALEKAPKPA